MDNLAVLLGGLALVLVPIAAILGPLLYIQRLVLHVRLVDGNGVAQPGVAIRGVRNRQARALGSTGSGHVTQHQLVPTTDSLGVSDANGEFLNTYYLRNYHTLQLSGGQEVFVDTLRSKMSLTQPAVLELTGHGPANSGADDDPYDFTGKRAAAKRGNSQRRK
jgi:hypothetical protein